MAPKHIIAPAISLRALNQSNPYHLYTTWFLSNTIFAGLVDALAKGLLSDSYVIGARILTTNLTSGAISSFVWWKKPIGAIGGPIRVEEDGALIGLQPNNNYPWYVILF